MSVIRLHSAAPVPKDELDRQAVGTAIVILHGEGSYYAAREVKAKMRKCGTCARWFDPSKTLQRKSTNACRECGRGYRKERAK